MAEVALGNGDLQAPPAPVLPTFKFPSSKDELVDLILKYQDLQQRQKHQAKQQQLHSQKVIEIQQKQQEIQDSLHEVQDHHLRQRRFEELQMYQQQALHLQAQMRIDPSIALEITLLEKLFEKVSNQHKKYKQEVAEFEQEVSPNNPATFNSSLLEKQIAGLQLLSKGLDLPEPLQRVLDPSGNETSEWKPQSLPIKYKDRIVALGLADAYTKPDNEDPLLAPAGNILGEQAITLKIKSRMLELESLPANLGTFELDDTTNFDEKSQDFDALKKNALLELKSLKVLAKQKQIRKSLVFSSAARAHYDVEDLKEYPVTISAQRSMYVRSKIIQPEATRLAEKLEEKRELEAKRIEHAHHVNKVNQILILLENIVNYKYSRQQKRAAISRNTHNFHTTTEKEELKKLEKTARQRLQALKANDEEAYIKLLDQTKDHRITHLLKQTNQFLDSLAQAVKVQQQELGVLVPLEESDKIEEVTEDAEKPQTEDTADELREKIDYYQVAHRIQEEITEQPLILVGGKLKEYQIKGLQWMVSLYNNKLNGILADEMGLGKTIQSISLVTYLIEKKHEDKFLVIVPLSTITNWTIEFEKWAPSVKVIVYKGSQQQRRLMQADIRVGNFQVMLTTYEYIIRERPILSKFNYSHMIIDEGHRMKNATSKLSITLKMYYRTKNRLILTGTPLQNNLPELWALLNFVLPKVFNSVKSFDEWFNTPFANTGSQEKIELTEEESLLVIRRLHKVLRPFLLRRLKKDVEKDLPDKVEKVIKCKLSGLQFILYQQMLKHNALFVGAQATGAKSGIKGLNNKIMQLRKICNHPFVFEEVEDVMNSSRLTNDLIWRVSGKFELLDRVLPKFKATGHRVLMFFQMTQVMDIMEDFLRWKDMKYLRLDGATKAEDRQDMLKEFNAPNSEYFCFLLSTRAGGLGLNLQTADTVIIFDTDWNPHQDLQAQDRAHRIGQKNEVRILRLITNDSVEEVILERAHQKLDIDGKVIQAGKFDNKSTAEEQEEYLKKLLEAEATRDDNEENDSLDDDELNEILARSEEEKELFNKMDTERVIAEKLEARESGGYKNRLVTKEELPSIFTEDISHHFVKDTQELSRVREKKRVRYDDGLTEEQWLMAIDNDDDSVEDAIRRKEARDAKRRKRSNKGSTEPESDLDDEEDDGEFETTIGKRRSRRRSHSSRLASDEEDGALEDDKDDDDDGSGDVDNDELQRKGNKLLDEICELTAESDGHNVSEIFLTLPVRKIYPDYYKIIKHPVAIKPLRKKLNQDKLESFEALVNELRTMCANAKLYNEEDSWVYVDAVQIEKYIDEFGSK